MVAGPERIDRRTAVKWLMLATAGVSAVPRWLRGAGAGPGAAAAAAPAPVAAGTAPAAPGSALPLSLGTGYGKDPDLLKAYALGDFWPLTFTPSQHRTAAALCDTILPADGVSPSASALKVQDFIDEWISAPYEEQAKDRAVILAGLAWLEGEAMSRFSVGFPDLGEAERRLICDDICDVAVAAPALKAQARFFDLFRHLTLGGFYTTPEGMKDVQFRGNSPSASFAGPSDEILARLGILGAPPPAS
jgi:hypothetical protein